MPQQAKTRVTHIESNGEKIVFTIGRKEPLKHLFIGYLYSDNQDAWIDIKRQLICLYEKRLRRVVFACGFFATLSSAATLYIVLVNQPSITISIALILPLLLAIWLIFFTVINTCHKQIVKRKQRIWETYEAYEVCRSDRLFSKIALTNVELRQDDVTPLSVIACKEVCEQWSRIEALGKNIWLNLGPDLPSIAPMPVINKKFKQHQEKVKLRNELNNRAYVDMSDRIIKTVRSMLDEVDQTTLYSNIPSDTQQALRANLHKRYIAPLVQDLTAIADKLTKARLELG